ncbi:MAG: phosphoribosylanthranilate isomerase [Planctomycetota bacterium]|nr:phosphoribosylanthranilate isomerase [Planctomycetota bacterium]
MFRTKICGITSLKDAQACQRAGVGAIGLNFYRESRRRVSRESAIEIARGLDQSVLKVGLFVNHPPAAILEETELIGLDAIQLHGDEPLEVLDALETLPEKTRIIRAIRISPETEKEALARIDSWQSHPRTGAFLLDTLVTGSYGGTGKSMDWDWLARIDWPTDKPVILAGGLQPENVRHAIETVKPQGVDVAGGVEKSPGIKCPDRIRDFVETACRSFDRI